MKTRFGFSLLFVVALLASMVGVAFADYYPPAPVPSSGIGASGLITITDITAGLGELLVEDNVQGLLTILVVLLAFGAVAGWFGARRRRR